jgi:hypothetical protein
MWHHLDMPGRSDHRGKPEVVGWRSIRRERPSADVRSLSVEFRKIPELSACAHARPGAVCISDKTQRTNLCRKHIFGYFVGDHMLRLRRRRKTSEMPTLPSKVNSSCTLLVAPRAKAASLVKKDLLV